MAQRCRRPTIRSLFMDQQQQKDTSFWVIADDHFPHINPDYVTSSSFQLPPNTAYFSVKGPRPLNITIHLFDPGLSPINHFNPVDFRSENCEEPGFLKRIDWCAQGCGKDLTPEPTTPTHFIIHHSAGTNESSDWPAVVREIWNLHVNVNRWDDIGYNWLIDPEGTIYLGRGDGLQGAHFCAKNQGTVGICVLGNFTSQPPSEQATNSLKELLSWLLYRSTIDPLANPLHESSGVNLRTISGHRDGCATACPGDQFYPLLDDVAIDLDQTLKNNCPITTSLSGANSLDTSPIILYPNPANSLLNIKIPPHNTGQFPIKIHIKNTAGQNLFVQQINQPLVDWIKIDSSNLPNGLYWLSFSTPNGYQQTSFIKY